MSVSDFEKQTDLTLKVCPVCDRTSRPLRVRLLAGCMCQVHAPSRETDPWETFSQIRLSNDWPGLTTPAKRDYPSRDKAVRR